MKELRDRMDQINRALLPLLEERMALSVAIGDYKRKKGLPIYDADREAALYAWIRGEDLVYAASVEQVFTTILKVSKDLQE